MTLLRFSIDKPEYEVLGDSIPVNFEDNKSYADLYLDKQKNRLVAVTSGPGSIGDTLNTVSIYTLSFPPESREELYQEDRAESGYRPFIIGAFLFAILLICIVIFIYTHYNREKQVYAENNDQLQDYSNIAVKPISPQKRNKSISLFGEFCVIDKDGNDITKEFSPMLKLLFILILLHTFKGGKGISSVKLKDTLWFDKTEESAKNNRGVSLNKLRMIFDLVGQINIKSNNSYWTVEFGDDVYCDYSQALYLIDKLSKNKETDTNDIVKLLSIVSGELLPSLQVEWVDPFKADFSNTLVDLLLDISKKTEIRLNPQIAITLADTIFIHDSLNEDALRLKCSLLVKMGRNRLAQKAYAAFTKEYNILFGTEFEYSFDQIINGNS
jgi:two-component SAPR family response regulator